MSDTVQTIRYWAIQAITGCPLGHEKGGGLACQDCIELAMENLIKNFVQELHTIVHAAAERDSAQSDMLRTMQEIIRRHYYPQAIPAFIAAILQLPAPAVDPSPEFIEDPLDTPRHAHYCSVGEHHVDCIVMICRHGEPRICWECKMQSPGIGRH